MIEINRHTLENGLRVLHHKDNTTQMVALNVLYDVGSKDEDPEKTGFAHLFEHLMFGGSAHIPDFDTPLQEAGGENNAWTSNDCTNYYCQIPKQNIETAFWLESDRMLALDFSQKSLDTQKSVVIEEFKQRNLNQPYGDIQMLIRPLAYQVHPYRWSTIGKEISHIEKATLEDVKEFFYKHYAPNNAILAITGNIDWEEALKLTEKWFGSIEKREIALRDLPKEPEQKTARILEVTRNVPQDCIVKAYHSPERTSPDYHTSDLLSDVLSNGRSARLFQELVMNRKLFSEVNAYIGGDIEPGLFFVTGKPIPNISLEEADEVLTAELEKLKNTEITMYELEKVQNKFESNDLFSNISYLNKASNIAYHELFGKAEDINTEILRYRAVTPEKIRTLANKIFRKENCSTLYYRASRQ